MRIPDSIVAFSFFVTHLWAAFLTEQHLFSLIVQLEKFRSSPWVGAIVVSYRQTQCSLWMKMEEMIFLSGKIQLTLTTFTLHCWGDSKEAMVSNHGLKGSTVHSIKSNTGCWVSQGHLTGTKGFMKQYPERKAHIMWECQGCSRMPKQED